MDCGIIKPSKVFVMNQITWKIILIRKPTPTVPKGMFQRLIMEPDGGYKNLHNQLRCPVACGKHPTAHTDSERNDPAAFAAAAGSFSWKDIIPNFVRLPLVRAHFPLSVAAQTSVPERCWNWDELE